jgi:hypothetical protein
MFEFSNFFSNRNRQNGRGSDALQNRKIITEARGLPGIGRPPAVDAVEQEVIDFVSRMNRIGLSEFGRRVWSEWARYRIYKD